MLYTGMQGCVFRLSITRTIFSASGYIESDRRFISSAQSFAIRCPCSLTWYIPPSSSIKAKMLQVPSRVYSESTFLSSSGQTTNSASALLGRHQYFNYPYLCASVNFAAGIVEIDISFNFQCPFQAILGIDFGTLNMVGQLDYIFLRACHSNILHRYILSSMVIISVKNN